MQCRIMVFPFIWIFYFYFFFTFFFISWRLITLLIWIFKQFFGHATWHVGSYFPDQGSNLHLLPWKAQSLNHWTTREVPVFTVRWLWLKGITTKAVMANIYHMNQCVQPGIGLVFLILSFGKLILNWFTQVHRTVKGWSQYLCPGLPDSEDFQSSLHYVFYL